MYYVYRNQELRLACIVTRMGACKASGLRHIAYATVSKLQQLQGTCCVGCRLVADY